MTTTTDKPSAIRHFPGALTPADVVSQISLIQQVMADCMREGEHYGTIPGCGEKKCLLKSGAEKLSFLFRFVPQYVVRKTDLADNHREYDVQVTLLRDGEIVGCGLGVASTMESKYRWRHNRNETVVGEIPKHYWDLEKSRRNEYLATKYGPGNYRPKKIDGAWMAVRVESGDEKMENPDIADTYNTVLKIAKKRAFVDAVITACAASDLFTQDLEDLPNYDNEQYIEIEAVKPHAQIVEEPEPEPEPAPPISFEFTADTTEPDNIVEEEAKEEEKELHEQPTAKLKQWRDKWYWYPHGSDPKGLLCPICMKEGVESPLSNAFQAKYSRMARCEFCDFVAFESKPFEKKAEKKKAEPTEPESSALTEEYDPEVQRQTFKKIMKIKGITEKKGLDVIANTFGVKASNIDEALAALNSKQLATLIIGAQTAQRA